MRTVGITNKLHGAEFNICSAIQGIVRILWNEESHRVNKSPSALPTLFLSLRHTSIPLFSCTPTSYKRFLSAKPAYTGPIEWLPEFFPGGKVAGALR